MRRDLAEKICAALLECSGKLDRSVGALAGAVEAELFDRYRRSVGQVLGTIYIEVLRDIFDEHPDLEPDSMK